MTPVANFATSLASVVDTGGKFAAGISNTGGNLPPVSTTPAEKFATGVNDTGGKLWEQYQAAETLK
jgi:hypothetical protein